VEHSFPRLDAFIAQLPTARSTACRFGFGLMALSAAFAFFVYASVYGHPEQDLPLWPAWIFSGLALVGLAVAVAALLPLPPFRRRA
jgi:hypothetical protein